MCDVGAGCSGTWANMRKMAHCGNLSVVNVTWPANSTRSHNLKLEDTRPFRGDNAVGDCHFGRLCNIS